MNELEVALYARVSGEQQVEEETIESQLAALRERIKQDGYALRPDLTFIEDGYTGTTLIRPVLEQLRDRIAFQGLDRLYVLCPDRLARKYAYQVLLIEEFQRAGVEVIFLNREISQNPEDTLLLQMQGMIAEYERAKIPESQLDFKKSNCPPAQDSRAQSAGEALCRAIGQGRSVVGRAVWLSLCEQA